MTDRVIALTEFLSLGYTQQQATDLVGAARHLAAASGLTQDDAERVLFRALQEFHPKAQRLSWPTPKLSGRNW